MEDRLTLEKWRYELNCELEREQEKGCVRGRRIRKCRQGRGVDGRGEVR